MDEILENIRIKQLRKDTFGNKGDIWVKESKGDRWTNQRNGNRTGGKRILNFLKFSAEPHFEVRFNSHVGDIQDHNQVLTI